MKQISSKDQIDLDCRKVLQNAMNDLIDRSSSNKFLIANTSSLNNKFRVFNNEYSIDRSNVAEHSIDTSFNNLASSQQMSSVSLKRLSSKFDSANNCSSSISSISSINKLCEPTNCETSFKPSINASFKSFNCSNQLNYSDFNKSTIRPMDYRRIFKLLLIFCLTFISTARADACQFPSAWTGLWFQKGLNTIQINQRNISEKGECIDQMNYNYVLENRQEKCVRCLMMFELHANVLQYRESPCMPYTVKSKKEFEKYCQIPPEEPLYSLFRVNSKPISCPFTGNFEFTYSSSNLLECRNPRSMAQSCTDDSNLLFKFQACADVPGSESKIETLECLASWKEGSYVYLVGRMSHDTIKMDQDKFRCFILDLTNNNTISLSQSSDASCEGLYSPADGIRSLKLTRLDANRASSTFFSNQLNSQPCTFPLELVNKRLLTTLDGTSIYEFANNFTLNIRNSRNKQQLLSSYTCLTQKTTNQQYSTNQFNALNHYSNIDRPSSTHHQTAHPKASAAWSVRTHSTQNHLNSFNNQPSINLQTRMSLGHVINNSFNASSNYLEYIIHLTKECSIGFACLRIYKRTSNIYEVWVGSTEKNPFDVCTYPSASSIPTTLTTLQLEPHKCPFAGVFALSNLAKGSLIRSNGLSIGLCAQSQLRVNCNEDTHKLELQARCSFQDESLAFNCNGGWKDQQTYYLLLTSEDGTNKYCLTYQDANSVQSNKYDFSASKNYLNQDHLFVSLNSISCHRTVQHNSKHYYGQNLATNHFRHSRGLTNFELIRQSSCYNSLEISNSSASQHNLLSSSLILIATILTTLVTLQLNN